MLLKGASMTIILIIAAIAAAIYLYAAIVYYYGFKNWYPLCDCKRTACGPKRPS
jgi:hypothetical protein